MAIFRGDCFQSCWLLFGCYNNMNVVVVYSGGGNIKCAIKAAAELYDWVQSRQWHKVALEIININ